MPLNQPQEAFTSTRLLFDVLKQHEDLTIRNASGDGQQALKEQDIEQLHYSLNDISHALESWEQHPALAKQLALAKQEVTQHQAAQELATAEPAPDEDYSPTQYGPSL